jgi:hypothetical protein
VNTQSAPSLSALPDRAQGKIHPNTFRRRLNKKPSFSVLRKRASHYRRCSFLVGAEELSITPKVGLLAPGLLIGNTLDYLIARLRLPIAYERQWLIWRRVSQLQWRVRIGISPISLADIRIYADICHLAGFTYSVVWQSIAT